jgi:DNA-binding LacI/PurR family transcriptional regulator
MATITTNIPDADLQRTLDAICGVYGYSATLENGTSNPETPAKFCKRMVAAHVRGLVIHWESERDANAARAAAIEAAQINIT